MKTIRITLDEDYPFLIPSGRLEIPVYGEAVVAYTSDENFWLEDLTLSASNGRWGTETRGWDVPIPATSPLWSAVSNWLSTEGALGGAERVREAILQSDREDRDDFLFQQAKDRRRGLD